MCQHGRDEQIGYAQMLGLPSFCPHCNGAGTFDDDPEVPGSVVECTWCNGTGDQPKRE